MRRSTFLRLVEGFIVQTRYSLFSCVDLTVPDNQDRRFGQVSEPLAHGLAIFGASYFYNSL